MRRTLYALSMIALTTASPLRAELAEPVRAMIEAAIDGEDPATVRKIIRLALKTNPDDAEEINALLKAYDDEQRQLAAKAAQEKEAALRHAGVFEQWSGKGEFGAFRSTGNSPNTGFTVGLKLTRDGINWRHKLRGRADYQRSRGRTTREQYIFAYEPNIRVNHHAFVFGLAQYEHDRFQGYSARYSLSGGLGYDLVDTKNMQLSVKVGPAWRRTVDTTGLTETDLAELAALDFDWRLARNIKLVEEASAYLQTGNSSFVSNTGLQANVADNISVRLSYTLEHDTNPPPGAIKTDTLSRVTLIYDF